MLELLIPKTGTVKDLLHELKKKLSLDDADAHDIRVYTVYTGKIQKELVMDFPIQNLPDYTLLMAQHVGDEDILPPEGCRPISCFSFERDPAKHHGYPFKFHLKPVRAPSSFAKWLDVQC